MNAVLDLLRRARDLIDRDRRWCQGTRARNDRYLAVEPNSEQACQWCSLGALDKIGGSTNTQIRARSFLAQAAWDAGARSFVEFNDTHSHDEVMALWSSAIQKALREPPPILAPGASELEPTWPRPNFGNSGENDPLV